MTPYISNLYPYVYQLLTSSVEVIDVDKSALSLVQHYKERSILNKRFMNDMLHIALATIAVGVLVSWNFKHIVRLDKIRLFNSVYLEQGYEMLDIYSPREVISYDQDT